MCGVNPRSNSRRISNHPALTPQGGLRSSGYLAVNPGKAETDGPFPRPRERQGTGARFSRLSPIPCCEGYWLGCFLDIVPSATLIAPMWSVVRAFAREGSP